MKCDFFFLSQQDDVETKVDGWKVERGNQEQVAAFILSGDDDVPR